MRTRAVTALRGHGAQVVFTSLSPDGGILATSGLGGADHSVKLWNVETAEELATLSGHTADVAGMTFSPDGERLVTQTLARDGSPSEVKHWRVPDGDELTPSGIDKESPLTGLLSPDGELYAEAGLDGTIDIRNAADGSLRNRLRGHLTDVPGLVFTPDSRRVISASRDRTIRIWDPREGVEVLQLSVAPDSPNDIAVSSDGSMLACATQEGTVLLWDARGVEDALRLTGHVAPIEAYGFAPDGRLFSRDTDGVLLQWALPSGESTEASGVDPNPLPVESPDGQWTVDIDRRDPAALRVVRLNPHALPFHPWEEAAAHRARHIAGWHAADAAAAEARKDWFAAVFHLRAMIASQPDDESLPARLAEAEQQLSAQGLSEPAGPTTND
jgi:WD40 repeat protein